ncbi:MAG: SMC-Scp complex subunit ScpB [Pseudomonadota bacterium]|jgi:segregation and condensation protein B|nr:SMC-Scp complex subunit ScpB [Pseudomonadota bacterium]
MTINFSLKAGIEALILASPEPLSTSKIISYAIKSKEDINKKQILSILDELERDYSDRGIKLIEAASGWKFKTNPAYSDFIACLWPEKNPKFSKAFLETIAIIAYKQPVTRGDIEDIRGVVVSTNIMRQLLDRGWIKKDGRREVPGRPSLYKTTDHFLDYFGLKSIGELPSAADFKEPISEPSEQDSGKLL